MLDAKEVKELCRLTDNVPNMALSRLIDELESVGNGAETWPFLMAATDLPRCKTCGWAVSVGPLWRPDMSLPRRLDKAYADHVSAC